MAKNVLGFVLQDDLRLPFIWDNLTWCWFKIWLNKLYLFMIHAPVKSSEEWSETFINSFLPKMLTCDSRQNTTGSSFNKFIKNSSKSSSIDSRRKSPLNAILCSFKIYYWNVIVPELFKKFSSDFTRNSLKDSLEFTRKQTLLDSWLKGGEIITLTAS